MCVMGKWWCMCNQSNATVGELNVYIYIYIIIDCAHAMLFILHKDACMQYGPHPKDRNA